jgi:hypothetical protein
MIPDEQHHEPVYRAKKRYLFFPWLGVAALWVVAATGLQQYVANALPFRLRLPWSAGFGPGMLLLLVGCSALWSHGFLRGRGNRGTDLTIKTVLMTLLVTACQLCLAAGIFFAGCLIMLN